MEKIVVAGEVGQDVVTGNGDVIVPDDDVEPEGQRVQVPQGFVLILPLVLNEEELVWQE